MLSDLAKFEAFLSSLSRVSGLRFEIRDKSGRVVVSSTPGVQDPKPMEVQALSARVVESAGFERAPAKRSAFRVRCPDPARRQGRGLPDCLWPGSLRRIAPGWEPPGSRDKRRRDGGLPRSYRRTHRGEQLLPAGGRGHHGRAQSKLRGSSSLRPDRHADQDPEVLGRHAEDPDGRNHGQHALRPGLCRASAEKDAQRSGREALSRRQAHRSGRPGGQARRIDPGRRPLL